MKNNKLTQRQKKYIQQLTEQLLGEFDYLNDAIAGRTVRRSQYTDHFLSLIKTIGYAGSAFSTLGVSLPIVMAIKGGSQLLGKGSEFAYSYLQTQAMTSVARASIDTSKKARELLVSEVAIDAAHLYEYAINNLLTDEGVYTFALIGSIRIVDYLIRQKSTCLVKQELLTGLVRGNSGAMIYSLTNNAVACQNSQTLVAEDLYARCAYRTPDGRLWANVDRINTEMYQRTQRFAQRMIGQPRDSHFGWVKIDEQNMPLCGYRWASYEEVKELEYEVFTVYPQSTFAQQFESYKPTMRIVDATDIASYMRARSKGYYYGFNQYVGAVARFKGVLSNVDLSHGNFSHSDFSDSIFVDCKLDHADFSNTQMQRCQLLGATSAVNIKLKAAQCAYLQAPEISFVRSDLDGADFYKANFQGADIRQTTRVDSRWEEANETRLQKGGVYHQENTDHFNPYAHEAAPIFTALKNNPTDANLIRLWLGAYLQPTLIKHLGSATAPFALLGVGDIAFINGRAKSHLQCVLITSENNTNEQQEQVVQIAPSIKKTLQEAMVILKSINITIELTFFKKHDNPPETLLKLRWQQGFLLGGNIELYTQYIQMLRREEVNIHQALTAHIRESNDPQDTIYYLASFYKIEWAPIKELLAHFSQRRLIHPQLAEDLTFCLTTAGVWHESFDGICTIWYDIIKEATQTTSLQLFSHHPTERLDTLNNCQHYFVYFSFRLQQAPDETARLLVLQAWQIQYQKLTQAQQLQWMEQLEQHASPNAAIKNALFNHLLMITRPNGWHYNLIYHRKQWLKDWQSLLAPDTSNQVKLRIPSSSPIESMQTQTLSSEITQKFLDEQGHFKASHSTQASMHPVYRIEHQGHTFWGKPIAEQPAIEYAVVELMKHIVGQTFLPETLITACHIPGRAPIAIQWSQHMPGKPLESLDAKSTWINDPLQNLSDESFLAHLFRVIITGPEDDSGKHLHLEPREDGKVDLYAVDLDRAFLTPNDNGILGFNKILQVKSMILCFNQMQQPIDLKNSMIQRFMMLDAHALLENWLESLIKQHKTYEELFNDESFATHFTSPLNLFTADEIKNLMPDTKPSVSILTLHLGEKLFTELNKRIGLMQSVLKRHWHENTPITGLELLTEVHPELGANYQSIFTEVIHNDRGFKGLSTEISRRAESIFKKPVSQLPKYLLPILRFWERTRKEYKYVQQKGQQQSTQAVSTALSASLRLNNPLLLTQAKEIRAGKFMSPYQAKEVLQTLRSQRGYEIIARLKEDKNLTVAEETSLIASFHLLSARQKKHLLKDEINRVNKINDAYKDFYERWEGERWQGKLLRLIPGTPFRFLDLQGFRVIDEERLFSILTVDNAGVYIKALNLAGCGKITDQSIRNIAAHCPALVTLNLNRTTITSIQAGIFAKFNSVTDTQKRKIYFPNLKYLSVKDCYWLSTIEFTAPMFRQLSVGGVCEAPGYSTALGFRINEISIFTNSGNILIDSIKLNQMKKELEEMRITESPEIALFPSFQTIINGIQETDQDLHVALYKYTIEADVNNLFQVLKENNKTIRLTLRSCLNDNHIKKLTEILIKNKTIKFLDLGKNDLTDSSAPFIAKILESNNTLELLDLSNNKIGSIGFNIISSALKKINRSLKTISFENNIFDQSNAIDIAETIKDNHFIESICMLCTANNAKFSTEEHVQILIQALLINRKVSLELGTSSTALDYITKLDDRAVVPRKDNISTVIQWAEECAKADLEEKRRLSNDAFDGWMADNQGLVY
ncbi:MAG: pentapeptide repeat-containing protein [Legionellales bacterium]